MRKVEIFDTTLRDGEQSAGVNLHQHEKLEIALQLERYGVDVMEAGFPASSFGDFQSVSEIAGRIREVSVAGLARSTEADIDTAWEALKGAVAPRLHVFLATSPIHMKHKLRMTPDEVVDTAVRSVQYAAGRFPMVEWSAEDATRSEWPFLVRIITEVINAGARVINVPDTVGYTTPEEYTALIHHLKAHVPNLHKAKLSAHCHDDLGMAVANTLAAIEAGVDQIEGTMNGIGERAGNAALEEVIVSLAVRHDWYQVQTGIQLEQTAFTSKLVSKLTGMAVPANKAIVGHNAFAHESGIHQDGVLKNALTYEIIRPDMVGFHSNRMVLGKHSGRHAFRDKCSALGLQLSEDEFTTLFESFKALTEKKKQVTEDDILALSVGTRSDGVHGHYELEFLHVSYALTDTTAAIGVRTPAGGTTREAATGNGSVEAIYNTVQRIVGAPIELMDYRIQSTTAGQDALAEVYVKVEVHGQLVTGRGVDNDVLAASAKAFLDAVSRNVQQESTNVAETVTAPASS